MNYQDWLNEVNELLKPLRSYQARNKHAYRAYLSQQTPQEFVDEGGDLTAIFGHIDSYEDETGKVGSWYKAAPTVKW